MGKKTVGKQIVKDNFDIIIIVVIGVLVVVSLIIVAPYVYSNFFVNNGNQSVNQNNLSKDESESGEVDWEKHVAMKPLLYLYPISDNTAVSVSFSNPDTLTVTYPKFVEQWYVVANRNGDLYDLDGKYYYGLYWEEGQSRSVDFSEGFYVTAEDAISFLEEKLSILGLNEKERNEFIMFWLPKLELQQQSLVYFELTDDREALNKLVITPRPDSLLRIAMHIKHVDEYTPIKEQYLPSFERQGFVAVEWGGTIH